MHWVVLIGPSGYCPVQCVNDSSTGRTKGMARKNWVSEMSGRKVLITFPNPPGEAFTGSKDSLARKLKNSSHIYNSGVFFSGAENNGGNSLGGKQNMMQRMRLNENVQLCFPSCTLLLTFLSSRSWLISPEGWPGAWWLGGVSWALTRLSLWKRTRWFVLKFVLV